MASPISNNDVEKSSLRQNLEDRTCELKSEKVENGSVEATPAGPENVDLENGIIQMEHDEDVLPKSGQVAMNNELANSPSKSSACKRKKVPSKIKSKRYPLRSSSGGSRVLRSVSNTIKSNAQPVPVTMLVNPVAKGRKKRRKVKSTSNDDLSLTRKRVRYLLTRMSYEQNLIDAYSGEGWKGQSAEKIRPEQELQRAKCEILRCKYKIRELFRILDALSSEGRFEESLFDSEGEIDNEDIFCSKCGLTDLSTNNDIILCDGICDRGFHQKCLNPPLLSEDIPHDDEGWLCPACDCKVDCIELLNESQGCSISIEDTWEKVFPEAGPNADRDKQNDDLPSDDSEDFDYNPDGLADVEDHKEKSDSDASDRNKQNENFGFPSDDSEDDEYDPDKSIPNHGSGSDESDFTSDSDEFCAELIKTSGTNEDSASSLQNLKPISHSDEGRLAGDVNNSELLSTSEPDLNQDNVLELEKRQLERLDYKKLYDEAYGKSSSDSSDDEDWSESAGMRTPDRGKKFAGAKESNGTSKARARMSRKKTKNAVDMSTKVDTIRKSGIDHSQDAQAVQETTPRETPTTPCKSRAGKHELTGGCEEPDPNRKESSASVKKRLGEIATQKLHQSFQENQYPTRQEKESLAEEIGLTFRQVDKWFVNARHNFRASAKEAVPPNESPSPNKSNTRTDSRKDGKRTKSKVVGAENASTDGESVEREKALARELKKMKQSKVGI